MYTETVETRGKFRARIHQDPDSASAMPDGDFFGFMYSIEDRRNSANLLAKAYSTDDKDYGHALEILWDEHRDWGEVRKALIDPAGEWAPLGVADMDWRDRRDYTFVNVVTREDLTIWGWLDVLGERAGWPTDEETGMPMMPCKNNFNEWIAWADGDVWYYTVEKRVTWTTVDDEDDIDDMETWEEVDSCHGYYGDEYARECALEALDSYEPPTPTPAAAA